jgi:hypothetical protein
MADYRRKRFLATGWTPQQRLAFVQYVEGCVAAFMRQAPAPGAASSRPAMRQWARDVQRHARALLELTDRLPGAHRTALGPAERSRGALRAGLVELADQAGRIEEEMRAKGPDNEHATELVRLLADLWRWNVGRPAPEGNFAEFAQAVGEAVGVRVSTRTIRAALRPDTLLTGLRAPKKAP